MKKLFQNKNFLLFTLILIVSCLGILGVGGKISAADYRCDNNNLTYNGRTANDLCAGGIWGDDCDDEDNYDYAFCVENNQKSVRFGCKKGWGGITCDCSFIEVKDCSNGCANGKCKTSSTPPAKTCKEACAGITTFSKCSNETCNDKCVNMGGNYFCRYNCTTKSGTTCKDTCICYDSELCDPCNATTCTATGCEKEVAVCNCTSYKDTGNCGPAGGCRTDQMRQTRTCTPAGCKSETQCITHSDCGGTTPTACYWQNINCGNAEPGCNCEDTNMCQKCVGDSGCSGGCALGQHQCVLDSNCGSGAVNNGGGDFEDTGGGGAVRFTNPLSTNSFEALIMGIINWILGIVVSLAILFLIIGGLMYIVSAGDEERIKKAKNIILYSVIGLGIVILSWSIITELKDILGVR
jgi:hypothetical protein